MDLHDILCTIMQGGDMIMCIFAQPAQFMNKNGFMMEQVK